MRKINFARMIWVLGVFLVLIVILIAVMDYKIHYQYKNNNTIYFYDCSGNLCVTEVEDDNHLLYSKYECGYEECPVFKSAIEDTYVILTGIDSNILYNYRSGDVISTNYDNYQFLSSNYFIVTKNEYQGVIDFDNNVTVSLVYDKLGYYKDGYLMGYGLNYIIAKKEDKYGLISIADETIVEDFIYGEKEIESLIKILNEKEKLL